MEKARATIKEGDKIILDDTEVEFDIAESPTGHKVLQGSFRTPLNKPLIPGFYELVLKDGCSYQIAVKALYSKYKVGLTLITFIEVLKE